MATKPLYDCTDSQMKRPEAIQFLMNFRQQLERTDRQFVIEHTRDGDGSSELVVKVSSLKTGESAKPVEEPAKESGVGTEGKPAEHVESAPESPTEAPVADEAALGAKDDKSSTESAKPVSRPRGRRK